MDATPISFDTATAYEPPLPSPNAGGDATGRKWAVLHDAAAVVAGLAGEPVPADHLDFPEAIRKAASRRRDLAEQGIEDLAAMMEPGLAALISVHGSGADASAPARALWQEFTAARDALIALVLPRD
jgi:hypothetical protein